VDRASRLSEPGRSSPKRRPPWGGLESREETPKEGIYGREPAPQQCNAAVQQLQAHFDVLFASRSGAPGHRTPLCRPRDTKTSLIARLPRSRAGVRGPARSWRSSQRGGYTEGPRLPSDRASLKVLATEARFFRLSSSAMSFSWKKDMGFPRSSSIRTPGRRSSIWALTNSGAAAANRAHSRVSLTAVPDTTTKPFTAPCLLFGEHSTGHDARASRVKPSQNAN
jgi:hypothetical protein